MNHLQQYDDDQLKAELARRSKERHDNFISQLDTVTIDRITYCYLAQW